MSELRTMETDFTKHSMRGIHEDEEINPNAPILPPSPLSPTYSYGNYSQHVYPTYVNTNQQPDLYTIPQSSVNASPTVNPRSVQIQIQNNA